MTPAHTTSTPLHHLPYLLCATPLLRKLITTHTNGNHCHHCATPIWPAACRPTARCRTCHQHVGPPPYSVELAAAAATLLLVCSGARGWELAAHTTCAMLLITLGFIDVATHRLPHHLTAAATLALITLLAPTGATLTTWLTATTAAAGLAAFHAILHTAAPTGLGLGDVAMTIPAGFALGWIDWRYTIAAALLAHATTLPAFLTHRVTGHPSTHQPFGAYLAATTVCLTAAAHTTG
jgi:leader peptidase (prepilin peptidase)/N-methyltransferase